MEERSLSAIVEDTMGREQAVSPQGEEARVEPVEAEPDRLVRAERRERKLRAKRRVRARKVTQKASRALPTDLELDRKERAAMQRHWKRIHEISGAILANLEAFDRHVAGK